MNGVDTKYGAMNTITQSGVVRAFPGGQVAHPEGQNEDEN